jgi:hypothetical protein
MALRSESLDRSLAVGDDKHAARDGRLGADSQMSELGFPEEMPREAKFAGVWRAYQRTSRGREESSYLYLTDDGRVGILSTFRP